MNISKISKVVAVFGFGLVAAFSYAKPSQEVITSYYKFQNGAWKKVGQKWLHCGGGVTSWGTTSAFIIQNSYPCD